MIFPSLFGISFANPWFLAAFLILPVLYFLLRVLPPPPKHVRLATAHFLTNLTTQSRTSSKTPWWILLLRLFILSLIILAFAGPYRQGVISDIQNSPLLLVIDNSWSAAKNWSAISQKANATLQSAIEKNAALLVAFTTPLPGKTALEIRGPSNPASLKSFIDAAGPQPVPADFSQLYQKLKDVDFRHTVFLSSGTADIGARGLLALMQEKGALDIVRPQDIRMPSLLKVPREDTEDSTSLSQKTSVRILKPLPLQSALSETLVGYDAKGEALFQLPFTYPAKSVTEDVSLKSVNGELLNRLTTLRLANEDTAGAVYLIGPQSAEARAGIAAAGTEKGGKELSASATYPAKALEPYAQITISPLSELLENAQNYNLFILPDISTAPSGELDKLAKWITNGGTLVRFGGSAVSRNNSLPVPVPLQSGERALGGSISWEGQQKLAPFPQQSPFRDIPFDEEIIIEKQILARPLQSGDPAIWAELEDGTPFITARAEGRGMIVMIHTTADPSWSDFALSGLYVRILKRLAELSNAPTESFSQDGQEADFLKPLQVLDGFGQIISPPPYIENLKPAQNASPEVSALTPPGLYGTAARPFTLNLGDTIDSLEPLSASAPIGAKLLALQGTTQKDYKHALFVAAFLLFLLDWAVIIYILRLSEWGRHMPQMISRFQKTALVFGLATLLLSSTSAVAQTTEAQQLAHINSLSLAYIVTGDPATDQKSQLGLETLAEVLKQRTSVEPDGVIALNPERDEFLFYPFMYWPVTSSQQKLSDQAISKLQNYMDRGGLIVLDTGYPGSAGADSMVLQNFLQKIEGLNLPPLKPMDKDHTLTRSFYLLDRLYGRENLSEIWVSYTPSQPEISVAALVIGGNDWAGGWTGLGVASPRDQEMALRTGVNITMYALTGNYKADQLHLPIIMERLGQ